VVWQEELGEGQHAVFVSRLVGDHFELFNSGQPVSNTENDATRPDITFSGNVPYVSWQETVSGAQTTFVGHFEGGAAAPVFVLDTPTGIANSGLGGVDSLRAPISSGRTPTRPTPTAQPPGRRPSGRRSSSTRGKTDTRSSSPRPSRRPTCRRSPRPTSRLRCDASMAPRIGWLRHLHRFDYGATTAYGTSTPDVRLDVASVPTRFDATLSGLTRTRPFTQSGRENGSSPSMVATKLRGREHAADHLHRRPSRRGCAEEIWGEVAPGGATHGIRAGERRLVILSRKGRTLGEVTLDQAAAGSFDAQISLKHIKGDVTLRVTATDADGASAVAEQRFRAR
jgi:hypothetical protein